MRRCRQVRLRRACQGLSHTKRTLCDQSVTGEEIKGITVFEVDNSRLSEALIDVGNYYVRFMDIHGFTYSTDVCYEAQEALEMIGLR